jgi:predicted DNA-binding transcriptional regulator AlpA
MSSSSAPAAVAEQAEREKLKSALRDEQEEAVFLNSTQVRQRYGGISDMTRWRWLNDENLGFPRPIVINRRRLFPLSALLAFEAGKASEGEGA